MAKTYDLEWYAVKGKRANLVGRCQFANVHSCPRHFQSVALLASEGITTSMPASLDASLTAKWQQSPLWPAVSEHATTVVNRSMFLNFCPEVSFDVFHVFGSYLSRHGDEIDREAAYRAIEKEGAVSTKDWRWEWSNVTPMHFSECPLFAQLSRPNSPVAVPKSDEIVVMKPGAFGFSIDLKRLFDRVARWWLARGGNRG